MLKFYDNNTTLIATFEDFILTVYVIIDDLYRCFAPPEVVTRRHVLHAKLSDSEIITISICGELAGIDSENAWYSFIKRNYRHLFPTLCSRSRFNHKTGSPKDNGVAQAEVVLRISHPCQQVFDSG